MSGLAPPTPYQWQVGDIGSASLLNSQLYNGLTYLLNPPIFYGVQASVQALTNSGTNYAVTLDTNVVDTYNGHSTTTNTSRYTAQVAGYYLASGCVGYATNATGFRAAKLAINGTVVQGAANEIAASSSSYAVTLSTPTIIKYLNVGDYIEVWAWQTSGGTLNTTAFSDQACSMSVQWVHA